MTSKDLGLCQKIKFTICFHFCLYPFYDIFSQEPRNVVTVVVHDENGWRSNRTSKINTMFKVNKKSKLLLPLYLACTLKSVNGEFPELFRAFNPHTISYNLLHFKHFTSVRDNIRYSNRYISRAGRIRILLTVVISRQRWLYFAVTDFKPGFDSERRQGEMNACMCLKTANARFNCGYGKSVR